MTKPFFKESVHLNSEKHLVVSGHSDIFVVICPNFDILFSETSGTDPIFRGTIFLLLVECSSSENCSLWIILSIVYVMFCNVIFQCFQYHKQNSRNLKTKLSAERDISRK